MERRIGQCFRPTTIDDVPAWILDTPDFYVDIMKDQTGQNPFSIYFRHKASGTEVYHEEPEITDKDRFMYAMTCMTPQDWDAFCRHVLSVGGTGDYDDCKTYIDKEIKAHRLRIKNG